MANAYRNAAVYRLQLTIIRTGRRFTARIGNLFLILHFAYTVSVTFKSTFYFILTQLAFLELLSTLVENFHTLLNFRHVLTF